MSISTADLNDTQRAMLGLPGLACTPADVEKATAKSERELQKQVIEYLRLHGIEEVLCPTFGRKSTIQAGWPDLTFVAQCRIHFAFDFEGNPVDEGHVIPVPVLFEIKLPKAKLTNSQPAMHERLKRAGWQVATIHSIPEARAELERIRYSRFQPRCAYSRSKSP